MESEGYMNRKSRKQTVEVSILITINIIVVIKDSQAGSE
jgi:hypothetical protein